MNDDAPTIEFMLFNVETRRLLPSFRTAGSIDQAEQAAEVLAEGDDEGNLSYVLGHYENADGLWVNWDGIVVPRDDSAPPLIVPPLVSDPLTVEDVWREKDRRLAAGFNYDFGDARGVHRIGTTPADMAGWEEVTTLAQALINAGNATGTILVLTDTGPAELTATEWQQVLLAAAAFRQPLWLKSFEIAAMNPIPADYSSDERWAA